VASIYEEKIMGHQSSWRGSYSYSYDARKERRQGVSQEARYPPVSPDLWPMFYDYLIGRGLDAGLARDSGWYPTCRAQDTLPRILIPATRTDGRIFWQARAIDGGESRRYQSPSGSRGDALIIVRPESPIIDRAALVEGPFDALKLDHYGRKHGVAATCTFGKVISERQHQIIRTKFQHLKRRYLMFDADAALDGLWVVGKYPDGYLIRLDVPPGYDDPSDLPPKIIKRLCKKIKD